MGEIEFSVQVKHADILFGVQERLYKQNSFP